MAQQMVNPEDRLRRALGPEVSEHELNIARIAYELNRQAEKKYKSQ